MLKTGDALTIDCNKKKLEYVVVDPIRFDESTSCFQVNEDSRIIMQSRLATTVKDGFAEDGVVVTLLHDYSGDVIVPNKNLLDFAKYLRTMADIVEEKSKQITIVTSEGAYCATLAQPTRASRSERTRSASGADSEFGADSEL